MTGEIPIPREILGQTPRRFVCQHELARMQLAAIEARQKIVDYVVGEELVRTQKPQF